MPHDQHYQTIHEKIAVAGVYANATFIPKKIRWGKKVLPVETITMSAEVRDGAVRTRMYSIVSLGTMYRVSFNRDTEQWFLEEVWCE